MSSKKDNHVTVTQKEYIGSLKSFLFPVQIASLKKTDKEARRRFPHLDESTFARGKEMTIKEMIKGNIISIREDNSDLIEPNCIEKIRSDMGYSDGAVGDRTYAIQIEPNTLMVKLIYLQGLEQL